MLLTIYVDARNYSGQDTIAYCWAETAGRIELR